MTGSWRSSASRSVVGGASPDPDRVFPPRGRHPARATLGDARQESYQRTWQASRCQHRSRPMMPFTSQPPRLWPRNSREGQHGHIDPLPAAVIWAKTSGNGQQLVEITVAQPGHDAGYRRPGRGGACGLRAGLLVASGVSGWPWGVGPWVDDHAAGAYRANVADRRYRLAGKGRLEVPSHGFRLLNTLKDRLSGSVEADPGLVGQPGDPLGS